MNKMVYSIANLPFAVVIEDNIEIKQIELFSGFVTTQPEKITFLCRKGIPSPDKSGDLYYQDEQNLIYKKDKRYQRYIGNFQVEKDWSYARTCLCFSEEDYTYQEVFFEENHKEVSEREIFNALGLEQNLLLQDKIIIHSSYITYENEGIIFTAPSGTGKSTQADLWKKVFPQKVEIINGDRSVLGEENGEIKVYGIPLCGTSKISKNKSVPLKTIVVLRQGPKNSICKLDQKTAIKWLFSECSVNIWDSIGVKRLLNLLEKITQKIPVWYLSCVPDDSAVTVLKEAIQLGETKHE